MSQMLYRREREPLTEYAAGWQHQNHSGHFRAKISPAAVTNLTTLPLSTSLYLSYYTDSTIPIPMWNAVSNIFIVISENKKLKKKTPHDLLNVQNKLLLDESLRRINV